MKRMKKFLVSALAAASFFLLTGCGNETIMEEYSFGYTQLKSGNSEVYLMTPVQLGEMHQKDGTNFYGANDAHWIITAESRPASSTSVRAWAEEPTYMLAQTATLSDLQKTVTQTTVLDKPATEVEATFNLNVQGRTVKMAGRSLFFEDKDQVWDITYLYSDNDAVGKEVIDHVFGQIKNN